MQLAAECFGEGNALGDASEACGSKGGTMSTGLLDEQLTMVIYISCLSSIFRVEPSKRRPFSRYIYIYNMYIYICLYV